MLFTVISADSTRVSQSKRCHAEKEKKEAKRAKQGMILVLQLALVCTAMQALDLDISETLAMLALSTALSLTPLHRHAQTALTCTAAAAMDMDDAVSAEEFCVRAAAMTTATTLGAETGQYLGSKLNLMG